MVLSSSLARADAFDDLRNKWKKMLTAGSSYTESDPAITARIALIDSATTGYINTLNTTNGVGVNRPHLWSDVTNTASSSQMTRGYQRLREMATAYATKNSIHFGSTSLRTHVTEGLEWMNYNLYNASKTRTGNWWDWRIGSPLEMLDAIVIIYNGTNISSALMASYIAAVDEHVDPGESFVATLTGANRSWTARVWAIRGILRKDNVTTPATLLGSASLVAARDRLSDLLLYSATESFHSDGSFLQHGNYPYNGGYGLEVLRDVPHLIYLLHGSTWAVTDTNRANVFKWIYDSYAPFIYKGGFMSMVRGREISREFSQDHYAGHDAMASLVRVIQLAALLSPTDELPFKRMLKYWLQQGTVHPFIANLDNIDILIPALAIRDDTAVLPMNEPVMSRVFPEMDRTVHLRPGFGFGVSMFSSRIKNYESTNGENKRAWHTASGMTYLYNADLNHYDDQFWPTINANRIPGTTVDTTVPANDANKESFNGSEHWVGGAEILGTFSVAGMSLDGMSNLTAKKSWFMFDDEIVALGSGINASGGGVIETIIENRKLASPGTNTLTVNGAVKTSPVGWLENMTSVSSIHLAGSSSSAADIGYYFPTPSAVTGFRQNRTDKAWADIGNGSATLYNRHYLTLWQNHTAAPVNATYAYVLLPGKTATQVSTYAAAPNIAILLNSTNAHAVKETTLNLVGVNVWNPTGFTVDLITTDRPASVLTKENTGVDIEVAVSDPTQRETLIKLEIDRPGASIISKDSRVTVTQLTPKIKLEIDVTASTSTSGNGLRGHTWKAKFSLVVADTTAPTVAVTAPTASALVRGTSVAVSATASDNVAVAGVQFKLDGANLGSELTTAPFSLTWDTTAATNASHALTAVARDAAGNVTTSATVNVTVDNSAPTVAVTAPTTSALVRGMSVAVSATATDNVAVVGVQFKLDGSNLGAEVTAPPFSLTWDTTAATNASHALTAVARDAAGNLTTSSTVNVTVDNSAPTVAVTAPTASAFVRGSTVAVSATASDNVAVVGVQFKLDGANLGAEVTAPPFSLTWDTTAATNASHALTAVARDAAGNLTTSSTVNVTVDNSAPTVAVTAPTASAFVRGSTVAVSATATDNVAVVGVQFKLDGANLGSEVTAPPFSLTWDTTAATNASHALTAVARDAAGNSTTSATVNVTVDNSAPTVAVTAPTASAFVRGTSVAVSATASDNVAVVGVQFKLDGANLGAEVTAPPFSLTWDTTAATNASHALTAVARDAAGNVTTSSTVNVTVDNSAPTVALTGLPNGTSLSGPAVALAATASDNVSVVGVQFQLDGVNLGAEDTATPFALTWDSTTAANGGHTLSAIARDAAGNTTTASSNVTVFAPGKLATTASSWVNSRFDRQVGTFTVEFDAIPSANVVDSPIGLSNGTALAPTDLATIVRFAPSSFIDARNGSTYAAATSIGYSAGVSYHVRLVVNIATHTYSAYVTPAGGSEQTLATNYAFRTEQSAVAQLNNYGILQSTASASLEVRNFVNSATTAGTSVWLNNPVESQAASFTAEFEATPSAAGIDGLVGLSNGDATALTSLAAAIHFNTSGAIDARNGGTYAAASTITYSANTRYRFRLVVNVPAHTYSAYVTRPGEAEQTIGTNYAFRTEQSSVALLTNLAGYAVSTSTALELRHIAVRDTALAVWLKLDSTTAGVAVDSSRQANHGTLVNAPAWTTSTVGDALDLDGTNDHATLPAGQATVSGGFTVAVLANPATVTSFARFIDFGNGQANNNLVFARGSSTGSDLSFWVYNGTIAGTKVTAPSAIALGSAQHFAATVDGSGSVKIYKNGVQVATGTTAAPVNVTRTLNYIGRSNWSTDGYYDGTLDELRVFTRVLTAAEVLALKNQVLP